MPAEPAAPRRRAWVFDVLLLVVLLAGAAFRLVGLYWGEAQYLHPDERFLVWVGSDITPRTCLVPNTPIDACPQDQRGWMGFREYFNTATSTLNPQNRGHGFYVYGTLPMFLTRYLVEGLLGYSGFDPMTQVGRALSALADLLLVALVYWVGTRLYDRRVGLLAAAFSAASVLQIQQSHFFTMDTFITLFSFLAFGIAARLLTDERVWQAEEAAAQEVGPRPWQDRLRGFWRNPLFGLTVAFGVALGLAVASKLNAAPMAAALPAAMLIGVLALPAAQRERRAGQLFPYLLLAAAVSLLVFRIFQPYAFAGPGFFGLKLNPQWLANLRELQAQSGGDVDFPPAMQWARRGFTFSGMNLIRWGLGLPLGLLAAVSALWMGWRVLKGEWRTHGLLWGWTALYFLWQSSLWNPTMRYQLPIYPMLAIIAAWGVIRLAELPRPRWSRPVAWVVGATVLVLTYAWAAGFASIYVRPITRIAASRWIYENIPGPITLEVTDETGVTRGQPLTFPYGYVIAPGAPFQTSFIARTSGQLDEIVFPNVRDLAPSGEARRLQITLRSAAEAAAPLATAVLEIPAPSAEDASPNGAAFSARFPQPVQLVSGQNYNLSLELGGAQGVSSLSEASAALVVRGEAGLERTIPLPEPLALFGPSQPADFQYSPDLSGTLMALEFNPAALEMQPGDRLELSIRTDLPGEETDLSRVPLIVEQTAAAPTRLLLAQPYPLFPGQNYLFGLSIQASGGMLTLSGAGIINEGDWDDGLPLRMDGYDGFGGIYPLELNLNMYWEDNPEKLARFTRILNEGEYLVISSNRQWGSLPRLPERFPMTSLYYRELLGCPPEQSIFWCYAVAEPGMFSGSLGFELIQTFESRPQLGPLQINDQFAEEAFTVYDHPKVLIFHKRADYDPVQVARLLGSIDFSQVIRVLPGRAGSQPANLLLPDDRLAEQRAGGTWRVLFNPQALINRYPPLAALAWYLCLLFVGLVTYPTLRLAFRGLDDRGYGLARMTGLLVWAYFSWLAGSVRIPYSRATIGLVLGALTALGLALAYRQREELRQEWRVRRKQILTVETLFLVFFLVDLAIRWANPDLWHPWKGGEKPMDFAYFNAVLKSTTFPPYDPWYAGGYLNYYYYGFVLFGTPVKFLGITPAVAYNLILPTVFALMGVGAYSVVWNLLTARREAHPEPRPPYLAALGGALGMAVLGNLGIVRMIWQGYQRLAAPRGTLEGANLLTRLRWGFEGFGRALSGATLPYGLGDWYWIPSRAIPGQGDVEPITEFPFFTTLYGDPHAHFFALPVTLLVLGFALAFLLGMGRWRGRGEGLLALFVGGLAIGALRPTNTWDFPPYLVLGVLVVGYATWMFADHDHWGRSLPFVKDLPDLSRRLLLTGGSMVVLGGLAVLLYQPYANWYGLGYTQVGLWQGPKTPLDAYLIHWGLFLFLIVSWLAWETRGWLAATPLSALRKLESYRGLIAAFVLGLLVAVLGLLYFKVQIAVLALPLAAWAGVLLLRPDQPTAKRLVLFLVGTGLVLTLMVEIIVLLGDIGRMNTVFKFYLQVWTLFAVAAGASLGWLWDELASWHPSWRNGWQVVLTLLVGSAALYPIMATTAKVKDRMAPIAPHTLDGMAYMRTATYSDEWGEMDLSQDYAAIQWLEQNVDGSPVIVEANLRNLYRWGSRISIYTGLPGVVGWEWHQQQQRALTPAAWVTERILEVDNFYLTTDLEAAQAFLQKYDVRYIIVGQQERGHYPGPGLAKFVAAEGLLWREVYQQADTAIYEVLPPQ